MDFSNNNLFEFFTVGDKTYYVTETLLSTWIVMAVLVLFAVIVRISLSKWSRIPKGFQNAIEALVELMSNFAKGTMGDSLSHFGGYFFSIFAFILLSNYMSLFGLRSPTADLATTAALALMTFFIVQASGIYYQRGNYVRGLFKPNPVFFILNVIGEASKPVSLAFRLFGNMLGGLIIVGLVYEMVPLFLRFVMPTVLHAYFDLFAGALQAFIFTVLSMTFITQQAQPE